MRYAVFSDIHGNLQALESVLERIDRLSVDRRLCLGDIVGYGANPNECVETVRRTGALSVAGNHDHAALGMTGIAHFNSHAQVAVNWTRDVLEEDNRQFLSALPLVRDEGDITCVHASPRDPDQWHYILTPHQAEHALESFDGDICLIGHSHRPLVVVGREGEECRLSMRDEFQLDPAARYVINGGSVGQPRDGNPDAGFLYLDTERRLARIERVSYDIDGAQKAIREAGLPAPLADRLKNGR